MRVELVETLAYMGRLEFLLVGVLNRCIRVLPVELENS